MSRTLPFRVVGQCIDCAGEIDPYNDETWRCHRCQSEMARIRARAIVAVRMAIKDAALRPASQLVCLDCEAPAALYEHRDYRKPLHVEPVCRKCNQRRGPALWRNYAEAA
jgi:hypothetical protein